MEPKSPDPRRLHESLAHWMLRCFVAHHPDHFNTITTAICRWLGHSYVTSYARRLDSNTYQHFCPMCCTFGPEVPKASIIDWREKHGMLWAPTPYPRLKATWLRIRYAIATLTGRRRNENSKERIYTVLPL